jgi:hypothetical protein
MPVTLDYDCALCAMREKLNYVLTVATLVARNAKEAMVESGGVCVWRESGGRFCVGAFGMNFASVAVKMFSHKI